MIVYLNGTTRKTKQDQNNNYYIIYNKQKYILTSIKDHTTILQNEKWQYDRFLTTIER